MNLHYAFNSSYSVLLDQQFADQDDLVFFEVSVVEYRAFGLRESHTAGLAFEHLVALGIKAFLDDLTSVSLPVVRTIRIQTYLEVFDKRLFLRG